MSRVVFFLEERSAQEMLNGLLPKIFPGMDYICIPFEGKQDLEKQLPLKLRGWLEKTSHFVVLRDQDGEDCKKVKDNLVQICNAATKKRVVIRIACRELESWYLGDLQSVQVALDMNGLATLQDKKKFRDPDNLVNAARELKILTNNKYTKIAGSRAIGPLLHPDHNRSTSFKVFIDGIKSTVA